MNWTEFVAIVHVFSLVMAAVFGIIFFLFIFVVLFTDRSLLREKPSAERTVALTLLGAAAICWILWWATG